MINFIDCSAAQRLEKANAESKYKTLMISTISHEIRAPVSAILGSLELLSPLIPKESAKLLVISKECCNLITSYINDLMVLYN